MRGGELWTIQVILQNKFLVRSLTWFVKPDRSLGLSCPISFAQVAPKNPYAVLSWQYGVNDYHSDPPKRRTIPLLAVRDSLSRQSAPLAPSGGTPRLWWMPVTHRHCQRITPRSRNRNPEYSRLSEERNPVQNSPQQIFATLYVCRSHWCTAPFAPRVLQGTLSAPMGYSYIQCIPH